MPTGRPAGEIASPSDPFYGAETTATAWEIATRYLVPALLRADGDEPAALEASWARVRGHEFAKAGFSGAVWDLSSRMRGIALAAALGGTRDEVVAGVSLGIEPSLDELLAQVELQRAAGYPRVKLKIAPGWDVEPVRAVRGAFPTSTSTWMRTEPTRMTTGRPRCSGAWTVRRSP